MSDDDPKPAWDLPVDEKVARYLITRPVSQIRFVMIESGKTPGLELISAEHTYLGMKRPETALYLYARWFHDHRDFFQFSPRKDGTLIDHSYTKRGPEMLDLFRRIYGWHNRNDVPWHPDKP